MKKIISLILAIVLLGGIGVSAEVMPTVSSECDISDLETPIDSTETNAAVGQKLEINAKSVILMEPHTGQTLYEDNADEVVAPASITKIMSLLLVMEAIDRGDMTLETVITASEHACSMGGSQIWLKPGETMTVDELLKAAVIASANDATVALGEAIAGSEEGFVAMMNERGKQLGMTNTSFINCTGLDADGHVTTAHDVAIMSCALIKHELIKNYSTVWMDSLRDGKSQLVNTNKLVRFYNGTTGLKTGTTSVAGCCLSATASRDGMELVAVVMHGASSNDRFNGAKKLLNFGFANYSFTTIDSGIESDMTVDVSKGTVGKVGVEANGTIDLLMKKTDAQNVTKEVVLNENIEAPVKKGDAVGCVNIYAGDEEIGVIPIIATDDVEKLSFSVIIKWIFKGMFTL